MSDLQRRIRKWFTIEGDTATERIRNGLPQLVVIVLAVWLGAVVLYQVTATVIDPITATLVLLIGGLYIGLKLRNFLLDST
ncbi:hypothetical protein K0C01_04065 [Salinarchaeum sp. IM2453]|uniref:hypothetical protein n=1 Tax=Salinarchaeum sp. IM2453 TaxID=2862870 RepID=UPI001C835665|nr:hypothetical protein [Salinarchaeum sp. IM2453]QZA89326.1 hypothetical protein K0C01_04065 [Salinarchaeum sp. IM2453]